VLAVAVPKRTVDFLTTTFSLLTLKMNVLDVDHFAVEHAVEILTAARSFALVGLFDRYFSLSLVHEGAYIGFRLGKIDRRDQNISAILRALHNLLTHSPARAITQLFMYGPESSDAVIHSLRSLLAIDVHRFEPMSNISFHDAALPDRALFSHPSTFCPALGAALRKDA
jgi:Tfp pilus assembly PilM family ATPase